jgi:hypothetical protein
MFRNFRALSAFVGLVALFFMSVAFLATCSDDGNEERPSGGSRSTPSQSVATDPQVTYSESSFEVYLTGSMDEFLNVEFAAIVAIDGAESKFDSVLIMQDSKLLNEGKTKPLTSDGRGYSWDTRDEGKINVSGIESCGKKITVAYWAYANGNINAIGYKSKEVTRDVAKCTPPSSNSIEPSSSSVVSIPLTPVSFGGEQTIRINQNTGVKLSTGESIAISGSDVYYTPNPSNRLVAGSGVKIMQMFNDPGCGCFEFTAIQTNQCGSVPTPTNTSQFFMPCGPEETSIDPYMPNNYYLIKTNSATEWSSGWYIIVSTTTPAQAAGNTGIEIKAWKVN